MKKNSFTKRVLKLKLSSTANKNSSASPHNPLATRILLLHYLHSILPFSKNTTAVLSPSKASFNLVIFLLAI